MSLKNKAMALGLSAAMLLSPAASLAESNYAAGELTTTAISDSYAAGNQLNLSTDFSLELGDVLQNLGDAKLQKKVNAVVSLLDKTELNMSFYDDFGTARIHLSLDIDGVTLLSGDALVYADGSVQIMTNLTGKLVLALPQGALSASSVGVDSLLSGVAGKSVDDPDFADYPAMERLQITASDISVLVMSHLLGWVSATQMDTGELYVFDDTYLDETDTRDAVAQRMIGTIKADEFNTLFWNVFTTICDEQEEFQQALADVLAENGVTRYQMRQVIDSIFQNEQINPATDYVQLSHTIEDDGALLHDFFMYDWHDPGNLRLLHGFTHAKEALSNARKQFELNEVECDVIQKHMFPLNIALPKYWETVLVSAADKISAVLETVHSAKALRILKMCRGVGL